MVVTCLYNKERSGGIVCVKCVWAGLSGVTLSVVLRPVDHQNMNDPVQAGTDVLHSNKGRTPRKSYSS